VRLARNALKDAVDSLNRLQMGASPRLQWAADPIDLSEIARDTVTMISPTAGQKRAHLEAEARSICLVRGDPLLLRQVVTNLVLNAIEAVPTGGHVWVRTGTRGSSIFLTVADDGPGIPDKYRDRLFEPHFTTKQSGSGIGLFVSYGIIREHRGELIPEGGKKGAVFTLLLPPA
jgi:signal transduction histidine kinase